MNSVWDKIFIDSFCDTSLVRDLSDPSPEVVNFFGKRKMNGGETVLDLGCGLGRNLLYLLTKGYSVIGLDSSLTAINYLSEKIKGLNRVPQLYVADMYSPLKFESYSIDIVISIQAIYHGRPEEMQNAINETYRILKKGGFLLFTCSLEKERSIHGNTQQAKENVKSRLFDDLFDVVDDNLKLLIPKFGREKGQIHYYPDESDIKLMTKKFSKVILNTNENNYYVVLCQK